LRRLVIGGAACPPSMLRAFKERHGIEVLHAWGMTEMSPIGTASTLKVACLLLPLPLETYSASSPRIRLPASHQAPCSYIIPILALFFPSPFSQGKHLALPTEDQHNVLSKQGRTIYGVDLRIVAPSPPPSLPSLSSSYPPPSPPRWSEVPWDGVSPGELCARGHWVATDYFSPIQAPEEGERDGGVRGHQESFYTVRRAPKATPVELFTLSPWPHPFSSSLPPCLPASLPSVLP
jgi:fatty-acyl-CoA synthase